MRKIWSYISAVLAGFILGMIAMQKLLGDQIEIQVRKIKNKKTSGKYIVTLLIFFYKPKQTRKEKRKARKQKRDKK